MIISVSDAKEGMILAKDVLLPNGNMLIMNQKMLTTEIINLLQKHQIKHIEIYENTDSKDKDNGQNNSSTTNGFPHVEVKISKNAMDASLIIEPSGTNDNLTSDYLLKILNENGVCFGIKEPLLKSVAEKWLLNRQKREFEHVAQGVYPKDYSQESTFNALVQCISTKEDYDKTRNCKTYRELIQITPNVQHVTSGMVIAEIQAHSPGSAGKNILGEQLFPENLSINLELEKGAELSSDNNQVIAKSDGVVFFFDNVIGVLEIDFDGSVEIEISPDKLSAFLEITPAGPGGKMPEETDIKEQLSKNGITFGIIEDELKKLAESFKKNSFPTEKILVAQGTNAVKGEDGTVEYMFNTATSLKPQPNPDGSVDYKNINIINVVTAKQKLVQLHPPQKGTPGKNVLGQVIPAEDGAAAKMPSGKNISTDPQDANCLIANIDGIVRLTGSNIDVFDGFIVPGNIDYSTGNVKYEKSVIVNGDVKAGFSINCGGDLQVKGTIEDCNILINGNVLCKLGFVGQGKGIIISNGDVNVGFTKNQTIKSRKNVNVAKEALNSHIYARSSIFIHGKPISVAGGNLMARDSITVYSVGNHSNIRTMLEVGTDYSLLEESNKIEQQLNDLQLNYQKLIEGYNGLEKSANKRISDPEKNTELLSKLKDTILKHKQQIELLKQRKKLISKNIRCPGAAFILFKHAVYPGTLVKICDRTLLIKETVSGPKKIMMVNNDIGFV